MIGMSEAVMPIPSGMEFPLPLAPLAGEGIASEQGFSFSPPPKEVSQWEQFEKCSQSLALAVKSLGDGIAKEQVLDKVEASQASDFKKPLANTTMTKSVYVVDAKEVVAQENPRRDIPEHVQASDFKKPLANTAMPKSVYVVDAKEVVAPENPRRDMPEYAQVKDFEKPLANTTMPKSVYVVDAKEVVAIENPRRDIPEYAQVRDFEKPLADTATPKSVYVVDAKEVVAPESPNSEEIKDAQINCFEKPIINTAISQQVQIPDSVTVSRLVDTIVEKIVVSSTLMSNGEGEISIQLKSNVLDGSSVKIEVKNGELKVVVEPASYIAEQIFVKSQEIFQNQLAERVTAWRVNVGVAAFDSRNHGKHRLEEDL